MGAKIHEFFKLFKHHKVFSFTVLETKLDNVFVRIFWVFFSCGKCRVGPSKKFGDERTPSPLLLFASPPPKEEEEELDLLHSPSP